LSESRGGGGRREGDLDSVFSVKGEVSSGGNKGKEKRTKWVSAKNRQRQGKSLKGQKVKADNR